MLHEINQIKHWLADHFKLKVEVSGWDFRIVGKVPDGEYIIPIGTPPIATKVVIRNDQILIPLADF